MVRNVWKDVSHILQCEIKLEHIILYHNENYHSNIDNRLINYCQRLHIPFVNSGSKI